MSIRSKLLVTYMALTALGMSVLAAYLLYSFRAYFLDTSRADLTARAAAISESVTDWIELNNLQRVDTLVSRYGAQEGLSLRVFRPDGTLLSSSSPDFDKKIKDWSKVAGLREALEGKVTRGVAKGVMSDDDRLYECRPLTRNGQMLGVLRISLTLQKFQAQVQNMILSLLWALLLTFALCSFISVWFARSIGAPIQAMRNFAVRLGGGHFGEKLNIPRGDELGQLATELNRMSERLASLDEERRTFLANVSHELRTPVSNVHVTLDALENGADAEPELRARFITTAQDETRRLSRLVQDLLDLGRLEAGVVGLERQRISLRHLIERSTRAVETRMRSSGIAIQMDIQDGYILADPERLLQAFLNILDNAIKFSPPKSGIFISVRCDGVKASIRIQDQGTGITPTDLPHIFEQFYTADPSRKRGGTGLGLAIAKRIVESHDGRISAESVPGRGALFVIELPLDIAGVAVNTGSHPTLALQG